VADTLPAVPAEKAAAPVAVIVGGTAAPVAVQADHAAAVAAAAATAAVIAIRAAAAAQAVTAIPGTLQEIQDARGSFRKIFNQSTHPMNVFQGWVFVFRTPRFLLVISQPSPTFYQLSRSGFSASTCR